MVTALSTFQKPRISFNKLCEFPHVSPSLRRQIAIEQKYPADFQVSYYQQTVFPMFRAADLKSGLFDPGVLIAAAQRLEEQQVTGPFKLGRRKHNVVALRRLATIASTLVMSEGEHIKVLKKAMMEREGVSISVRPEFITYNHHLKTFALTKFRFSQSPVSADAAETGVALLLEFAKEPRFAGWLLDLEQTTIVDVFSGSVIRGHTVGRHRGLQLSASLQEFAALWPTLRPPGDRNKPLDGPAG